MGTFQQTELLKDAGADKQGDQHRAHDRMMIILEGDFTGGVVVNIETRLDESRVWQVARGADGSLASFILSQPNYNLVGIVRGSQLRAVTVGGDVSTSVTVIAVESAFSDGQMSALASLASAINPTGGMDVNLQDQTTRPLFLPFVQETATITTLTAPTVVNSRVVNVDDETAFSDGDVVGIFGGSFYFATIVSTSPGVLKMNAPLDFAFQVSGSIVQKVNNEMNTDGSSTPQAYSARGAPGFDIDVTRILLTIILDNPVDMKGFADNENPLPVGLHFRRRDGAYQNFFTIRKNIGFVKVAYDVQRYSGESPKDVDALSMRLTFGGQNKLGVVVRLSGQDDRLEVINQDNLSASGDYSINSFQIIAEGHVVD